MSKRTIQITNTNRGIEVYCFGYEPAYYHVPNQKRFIQDCKNRFLKKNGINYHTVRYQYFLGDTYFAKERV